MQPSDEARERDLVAMGRMLRTPDGQLLMRELELIWNPEQLLGQDAEETAYKVGLRDAYTFLKYLQERDDV